MLDFHRKVFRPHRLRWEFLNEQEEEVQGQGQLRKYIEIAAGHCDVIFHPRLQEFVEIPKSISFAKMDNTAFSDLSKEGLRM